MLKPKRFKVIFGGRGGYKTTSVSKILPFLGMRDSLKIVCLREQMKSIEHSVHSSIKKEIENIGASDRYRVLDKSIKGLHNKTVFAFDGMTRGTKGIKSYDEFNIAWIEEGERTTKRSLDDLIPTIIRNDPGEIWITFNPDGEFDEVYSRFVKPYLDIINQQGYYEDEYLYVVKTSLDDNPFYNEGLLSHSAQLKKENYKEWLHIYGGEVFSDYKHSIIQPEWFDAAIDAHIKLKFKPVGVRSVGFDLADTGDDKALMYRHGSVITDSLRWSHGELPEAIDTAFEGAETNKSEFMVYDDDGLGKSMKVYLANVTVNKGIKVIAYNGNASVDDPDLLYPDDPKVPDNEKKSNKDTFRNKKAQKVWGLRDRFEATYNAVQKGIYTDPDNMISLSSKLDDLDVLKSEAIKVERKRGQNSFIQIRAKGDKNADGTIPKSPNMWDSLTMAFANPPPTPEIVSLEFTSEW